jgi:uncharacterized protein YlxW (UPF0749 family)
VKQRDGLPIWLFTLSILMGLAIGSPLAWCQNAPPQSAAADTAALTSAVRDLQQQVQELRSAVTEMRSEAAQYRQQTNELRHELELTRQAASSGTASGQNASTGLSVAQDSSGTEATPAEPKASLAQRVGSLEETTGLLNDKLNDQAQTRVESAS